MKNLLLMSAILLAGGRFCLAQGGSFGGAGGAAGGGGIVRESNRVDPALNEANKRRETSSISGGGGNGEVAPMLIDASVLINVRADEYVAVFALSEQEKTVAVADSKLSASIAAFRDSLRRMGLKEADVFVDFVLQNRVYNLKLEPKEVGPFDSKPERVKEELVGFELKKNISIRFKNKALLEPISSAAAKLGIYDLVKVDYVVKDIPAIQAQLQAETARVLKAKIERYALFGVPALSVVQILADSPSIYYPLVNYSSYQAAESNINLASLSPDRYTIERALKTRTYYFNPLDGSVFDTVVNPVIIEPVVQFTSYVRVRAKRLS